MSERAAKTPKLGEEHRSPHGARHHKALQEARLTMARIKALNHSNFSKEGVVTELPYPALSHVFPGPRPGTVIKFVGRQNAYPVALKQALTCELVYQGEVMQSFQGLVITGPSGSGKSCLLRALTCELIARLQDTGTKVICFWYFDAFRSHARQVRDALLFTYCEECETEPGLADQILNIRDVESLSRFLEGRTEEFCVVTDEERQADGTETIGSDAAVLKAEAGKWLDAICAYAEFEIRAFSPKAEAALSRRLKETFYRVELKELFLEGERNTFLARTVLGRLLSKRERRWSDVNFYAGMHPLSLWNLVRCCVEHVMAQAQEPDEQEDWVCLLDKDAWLAVLDKFRSGAPFSSIRDAKDISLADKSFRLGECFCSDYLYTVYMDAAGKSLQAREYRCTELTAYVNLISSRGVHFRNWSALGWACETFMGDAILKAGISISGLGRIAPKAADILFGGQPIRLDATKLKPGESKYWSPARYSFKYVDGIILHMDDDGVYHMILVQDTVSPEGHRGTEVKFMQRNHVQKWWPVLGCIRLHYVYICPKLPASMGRRIEVKAGDEVKGVRAEVDYIVHVEEMAGCVARMHNEEYKLLERLAEAREDAVRNRAAEKLKRVSGYKQEADSAALRII